PLEALQALEDRDRVARAHLHDRLLPRSRAAGGQAAALGLGLDRCGADLDDLDVEERLDGLADLRLVRLRVHAERVLVVGGEHVALLADDGTDDDLRVVHYSSASSASSSGSSAASSGSGSAAALGLAAFAGAALTGAAGSAAAVFSPLARRVSCS